MVKLVFDTAKSSARLDNAATNPSTHYNSPVYRTHPHGYNFFIQFYPYGLNAAAGNHASIMFALFPGDYDGLLTWPFPKKLLLVIKYKGKLKDWNCTKRRKSKISKSVEMWFNAIGSTTSHEDVVITSFPSWYETAAWPFLTYSLTGRQPYSFPLFHFLSLKPRFPFLLAWLELS